MEVRRSGSPRLGKGREMIGRYESPGHSADARTPEEGVPSRAARAVTAGQFAQSRGKTPRTVRTEPAQSPPTPGPQPPTARQSLHAVAALAGESVLVQDIAPMIKLRTATAAPLPRDTTAPLTPRDGGEKKTSPRQRPAGPSAPTSAGMSASLALDSPLFGRLTTPPGSALPSASGTSALRRRLRTVAALRGGDVAAAGCAGPKTGRRVAKETADSLETYLSKRAVLETVVAVGRGTGALEGEDLGALAEELREGVRTEDAGWDGEEQGKGRGGALVHALEGAFRKNIRTLVSRGLHVGRGGGDASRREREGMEDDVVLSEATAVLSEACLMWDDISAEQ